MTQRAQYCFRALLDCFRALLDCFRALLDCFRALLDCFQHLEERQKLDCIQCSEIFLRA